MRRGNDDFSENLFAVVPVIGQPDIDGEFEPQYGVFAVLDDVNNIEGRDNSERFEYPIKGLKN